MHYLLSALQSQAHAVSVPSRGIRCIDRNDPDVLAMTSFRPLTGHKMHFGSTVGIGASGIGFRPLTGHKMHSGGSRHMDPRRGSFRPLTGHKMH